MDISLLSKMVRELILDYDRVALPGLGSFIAQMVPSSFSDKGFTIHPPYKRLSFRNSSSEDDLLVQFYARANDVDLELAGTIIRDFVGEIKDELNSSKIVVFPGLGKLRATKENIYFFIVDEDIDIWPAGSGMQPISLKFHNDEGRDSVQLSSVFGTVDVPDEVTLEDASPVAIVPEEELVPEVPEEELVPEVPEEELVPEVAGGESVQEDGVAFEEELPENDPDVTYPDEKYAFPVESRPVVGQQPVLQSKDSGESDDFRCRTPRQQKYKPFQIIVLVVFAVVVLLLCIFILLAHFCPDFIDKLLYSPAELEILRYAGK